MNVPLSGESYIVRCSEDPSTIAGASELLKAAAPAIASFPNDPAANLVACSIGASASGIRGLLASDSQIPVEEVLLAADVADELRGRFVYTTRQVFLGSAYLAEFLAGCLVLGVLLPATTRFVGWRRDIAATWRLLLKAPYLTMLPALTSSTAKVIAHAGTTLLLAVSGISHVVELLVYAPVMEEIVYRCLLYELVRKYSNPAFSCVFVSLAFALGHEFGVLGTLGTFVFGLTAQYLYIRYRLLSLCILSHVLANGFSLALG